MVPLVLVSLCPVFRYQSKAGPTSTFLVCVPPPPHTYWHAKYSIRDHVPIDVLSLLLNLGSKPICLKH